MSIQCITFDLDNTLWPIKPIIIGAEKAVKAFIESNFSEYSQAFVFEELVKSRQSILAKHPELNVKLTELRTKVYYESLRKLGVADETATGIAQQAVEIFLMHRNKVQLFEGVESALAELSTHYLLGAITNGNVRFQELSIANYFSFYLSAENVGVAKPDKKIFDCAIKQAQRAQSEISSAKQILHVGDDLHYDVYGANQAGLLSCWIPFGEDAQKTYNDSSDKSNSGDSSHKKKPDITIRHLNELFEAVKSYEL